MLASITPLGERGRHARWGVTVTAFVIGSTAAALAAGALLGAAGSTLLPRSFAVDSRLAALAAAAAVAILLDARAARVPGPRRQVDEGWLDAYRGWVYGVGFGTQLGLGFTTVVSSAATYLALIAAFLTGDAARGALVLACFGAVRGLSLLVAARVRAPEQLMTLHARLAAWRAPAARAGLGVMGAIVGLAIVGSLS
jgi:hypothetical protein